MSKKYFYERSNIQNFESNITFHELLELDDEEYDEWVRLLRKEIREQWDNEDTPPRIGRSEEEIVDQFGKLRTYDVNKFYMDDPSDEESLGVIKNFNKDASPVNQFFPTMMKTRITQGKTLDTGISMYDFVGHPDFYEKFKYEISNSIRGDRLYVYSKSLSKDPQQNKIWYDGEGVIEWLELFDKHKEDSFSDYGIWIRKEIMKEEDYEDEYLHMLADQVTELYNRGILNDKHLVNIEDGIDGIEHSYELKSGEKRYYRYLIRYYSKDKKLFPGGIQIFRIGFVQAAVNFPPLTARFLYEKYTKHIDPKKRVVVYDPSSGWGGRILGAMCSGRTLHYVGTDPNTDNYIKDLGITRYEYLANFYNENCVNNFSDEFLQFFEPDDSQINTYDVFMDGSEEIRNNKEFQKYKGKFDLVFTSPPYFNREQYSDDDTQSCRRYLEYDDWRDNFLRPTLETAYEYLANDRYLLWNVADIKIGENTYFPIERDSKDILLELGCEYRGFIKMLMTRILGTNAAAYKNSWYHADVSTYYKYEPILVFYKP